MAQFPDSSAPAPARSRVRTVPAKTPRRQAGARVGLSDPLQAVESWENEGGQVPDLRGVSITPTDISPRAPGQSRAIIELVAMRAKFLTDFSGGLIGQHHNTFQHRSRTLRQSADRCRSDETGELE